MTTIHWRSGGGDWSNANRWREGVVPGAADTAVIGAAGDYQVTIDSDIAVGSIDLKAAGVTLVDNGTITLGGTLDVNAGVFELLDTGGASDGAVVGGTIVAGGGAFDWQGGVLSGVTFEGALTVPSHEGFTIENFLAVTGANGVGPGVVQMDANSAIVCSFQFAAEVTLDDMTLTMGAAAGPTTLVADFAQSGATGEGVILGPAFLLDVTGPSAVLTNAGGENGGFILEGAILVGSGGALNVEALSVQGEVTVDGGVMTIGTPDGGTAGLGNLGGTHTLTGGGFTVTAAGTLDVHGRTLIYTDDATIVLDGAGSVMESFGNGTDGRVTLPLDQTLTLIDPAGVLEVLGGRGFAGSSAFNNRGMLDLGGGTFAEASVKNSGTVEGFGTIAAPVNNTKTISAAGGVLEVTGTVSGSGHLIIGAASELRLDAAASATTAAFAGAGGTLAMADPDSLGGKIAGFAVGDTIDLIGIAATSAVRTPGTHTLVVSDNGTTVATLQLSGVYTHDTFHVASDGHGGADITLVLPPAQLAQAMAAMAPTPSAGTGMHAASAAAARATLATPGR